MKHVHGQQPDAHCDGALYMGATHLASVELKAQVEGPEAPRYKIALGIHS